MYVLIYFYLSYNLIVSKNYFIFLIQKEKKNFVNKKFFFLYLFIKEVNFKTI